MLREMAFCALLGLVPLALLLWEARRHSRSLQQIPLRILVNGTRGKSSVTRLIAAGLRAGGYTVMAKTTGTEARIILSDGREENILRHGPANIREMIGFVARAASSGANAIVAECMAVRPELQRFCEHRIIRSHIGVITNIRPDHEEVMGFGIGKVAAALSNTIPGEGLLITTTDAGPLLAVPATSETRIETVSVEELKPEYLSGFPYEVVAENVALALRVCERAGVDAATALKGMRGALPDPGNVKVREYEIAGKSVRLVDALAANDPESTLRLWRRYVLPAGDCAFVLFNARTDRKYRTAQLCRALADIFAGGWIVAGDTSFACRQLRIMGVGREAIYALPSNPAPVVLEQIIAHHPLTRMTVFAIGNVQGAAALLAMFNSVECANV